MLGAYERQVRHYVYRDPPKGRKTAKQKQDEARLAKVDKLTVPDDQLPPLPPPQPQGGKRRR